MVAKIMQNYNETEVLHVQDLTRKYALRIGDVIKLYDAFGGFEHVELVIKMSKLTGDDLLECGREYWKEHKNKFL